MTTAVCIKCGAIKLGALTPCHQCNFGPESNEDKAKSMVLTDHFLPEKDLNEIAKQIENNEEITYPDKVVQEFIKTFEENPDLGVPASFKFGCFVIIGILVALVVWLIIK